MSSLATSAAEATRRVFGSLDDGRPVESVTLTNGRGFSACILAWGATLQSLSVPDREGKSADIVLGHTDMRGYLDKPIYFGSSVGRYANRIARARFALDGKTYVLDSNDGEHSLHGGGQGFDKRLWTIAEVESGRVARVVLRYVSPDGEEGYPGTLSVFAIYSLDDQGQLAIEYRATTDKPTIVNLTAHSYFNLTGEGSRHTTMGHLLTIAAEMFTPADATLIPTGELRAVAGSPLDFREPREIGARIRDGRSDQLVFAKGYDHNWVIASRPTPAIQLHARLEDPGSGRVLEVLSNQPGLQFYSGNFLDGSMVGKSGRAYRQGDGLCLEPQLFPDTPNQPQFGSARLDPGQTYINQIVYRFSTSG